MTTDRYAALERIEAELFRRLDALGTAPSSTEEYDEIMEEIAFVQVAMMGVQK